MINQILIAFAIYFSILLAIGVSFYRKTKTAKSFIIGNRSLNYWVTAISAQSSDMGAWLFLAYPVLIYTNGLFEAWTSIGLFLCMFLNWKFIASKIRAQTEHYKASTIPAYLESRFSDTTNTIRTTSALISIFFFILYIASGLVALGRIFESAFDISYHAGIIIGLLITVLYTLIGGFLAVSWCNLFQGLFLLLVIFTVPIVGLKNINSLEIIKNAALAKNISLSLFPNFQAVFKALGLTLGFGLGYFGQPHILASFMGINNTQNIKKSTIVGITWQIIVLTCSILIGLVGIVLVNSNSISNPEHLFVSLSSSILPPFFTGLALCGILAATLSTINSQILVSAANLAEDFYYQKFHTRVSDLQEKSKVILFASRVSTVLISLISLVIAYNNSNSIYDLVLYAWSGMGSAFGPTIILALYSKKINHQGALVGMTLGAITAGVWPLFNNNIPALVIGFIANFSASIIISKLTKNYN